MAAFGKAAAQKLIDAAVDQLLTDLADASRNTAASVKEVVNKVRAKREAENG